MPTKRRTLSGLAAVSRNGVCAGNMASMNGKATVAPTPRRKVRRGMCLLVMNICLISILAVAAVNEDVNELQQGGIPLLAVMQGGEYARIQFVHIDRRYSTPNYSRRSLPS